MSGVAFAGESTTGSLASGLGSYRKLGDNAMMIVLKPGAKLMATLTEFQAATHIKSGALTGVGVVRNTVLGYYHFNPDGTPDVPAGTNTAVGSPHREDTVPGAREIASLTCNFTTRMIDDRGNDLASPPHCHIALAGNADYAPTGQGWPVVGGHLIEAEVGVTAELIVTTFDAEIIKRPSFDLGGYLIDLLGL
jgi:predicted DNA-binding protein with PD1-like motif